MFLPRSHFSRDIKTTSTKGLILHVPGAGTIPLLALYIANSKIKMSLGEDRIILHKQRSNDGKWHRLILALLDSTHPCALHLDLFLQLGNETTVTEESACVQVEFRIEKSTFHLLVDGVCVTDGHLPRDEGSSLDLHSLVYLGGDPGANTTVCVYRNVPQSSLQSFPHVPTIKPTFFCVPPQGHNVPMNSVIGCVRNFKLNEDVLWEPEASHRTAPCFNTLMVKGTHFGSG